MQEFTNILVLQSGIIGIFLSTIGISFLLYEVAFSHSAEKIILDMEEMIIQSDGVREFDIEEQKNDLEERRSKKPDGHPGWSEHQKDLEQLATSAENMEESLKAYAMKTRIEALSSARRAIIHRKRVFCLGGVLVLLGSLFQIFDTILN